MSSSKASIAQAIRKAATGPAPKPHHPNLVIGDWVGMGRAWEPVFEMKGDGVFYSKPEIIQRTFLLLVAASLDTP